MSKSSDKINSKTILQGYEMSYNFLDFEQPIAQLQAKIDELRLVATDNEGAIDLDSEIKLLEQKVEELTNSIFSNLNAWQTVQLARHPDRPYTQDYIEALIDDFQELHGDRHFANDNSLICGIGRFESVPCVVIGHQKGRDTKDKIKRNFGMPKPEGYRKALRIMKLAEKFNLPVLTFIDTPGAYPGIDAEKHNQSEAIAVNLQEMSRLNVPIIATIIGEGGSGGALAIGVADKVNILQYSVYSVISPEGCASILWKTADKAVEAAEILGITSDKLKKLAIVDEVIEEPFGGAHRNYEQMMANMRRVFKTQLEQLLLTDKATLKEERLNRFLQYGLNS
jgi:acetyl-CoA carboxylase carboxyl transferase subunit alpha